MTDLIYRKLTQCDRLHFIGICGVSMYSLAIISARAGYTVSGSDTADGPRKESLLAAGIPVQCSNSPNNLPRSDPPEKTAVVYTAAIDDQNPELSAARALGMTVISRAELMGYLLSQYHTRIGVSGTHGKSTVCAMLAAIYEASDLSPTVLCGAEIPALGEAFKIGKCQSVIFEACEYKDSFLKMDPTIAVITNIEEDHPDFFKGMDQLQNSFLAFAQKARKAIINIDLLFSATYILFTCHLAKTLLT